MCAGPVALLAHEAFAFTGIAAAGECPAGKMEDGAFTSGPDKPVGVTDAVIASIALDPKGGDARQLPDAAEADDGK